MSDFRTGMSGGCMVVKYLKPGMLPKHVFADPLDGGGFVKYVPERTCINLGKEDFFACSECSAQLETVNPTYGYENVQNGKVNFCPNCGAKIEGESR